MRNIVTIVAIVLLTNEFLVQADEIRDVLKNKNNKIYASVVEKLIKNSQKDISVLEKYINDSDWVVRYNLVADVLSSIHTKKVTGFLLNIVFNDKQEAVRYKAIECLQGRENQISSYEYLKLLNDKEQVKIVPMTLKMLEKITVDDSIKDLLVKKLGSSDWDVKCKVADSLSRLKGISITEKLDIISGVLTNECIAPTSMEFDEGSYAPITEIIKIHYMKLLMEIGKSNVTYLKELLKKIKNNETKNRIIIILSKLGEDVEEDLIKILNSKNGWLRASAVRSLGERKSRKAIGLLKELLNDEFYVIPSKTDVIVPRKEKKIYPVREEAWSALLSLGIKVERQGNKFWIKE